MFVFKPCFIFLKKKSHFFPYLLYLLHFFLHCFLRNQIFFMDRSSQCPSQNADSPFSLVRSHLSIIPHYRQPIAFHKRRFSILIGPFLIDSCRSNDVTGDLHNFWTNQRPSFVLPHPLLLLSISIPMIHDSV